MVMGDMVEEAEVLVIGAGPGGYAAAFRAADLGHQVTMVDAAQRPGGDCLHRACIPLRTYVRAARTVAAAAQADEIGVSLGTPKVDAAALAAYRDKVVARLTRGLASLCEARGIRYVKGHATVGEPGQVHLDHADITGVRYRHLVLATGSGSAAHPALEPAEDSRIVAPAGALALDSVPKSLLVVGGGYVGVQIAALWAMLGSAVTLAMAEDDPLPGADPDLARPLRKRLDALLEAVHTGTDVASAKETKTQVKVSFDGDADDAAFERVVVAAGRRPRTEELGLDALGVALDDDGFVEVDAARRTSAEGVYAVGDLTGGLMLAHEAIQEGKVAAEAIAGEPAAFDMRAIPIAYATDPELAWCGLTETEAKDRGIGYEAAVFPWQASGGAVVAGATGGRTKLVLEAETGIVLGAGAVGPGAEAIVAEAALAVEMGARAEDLAWTAHPHPTVWESLGEAAEMFLGRPISAPPAGNRGDRKAAE